MSLRFSSPETHYRAVRSATPHAIDGYGLGEIIEWECAHCGGRAAHIDGVERAHWPWCQQCGEVETDDAHGPGFDGIPHR